MDVRQEILRIYVFLVNGIDAWLDGANVIPEVGCAGRRDTGENCSFIHESKFSNILDRCGILRETERQN